MQARKTNKLPIILTIMYVVLVLLSIVPIFTGDDPLDAVFFVLLTFPWSFLMTPLVDAVSPNLDTNVTVAIVIGLVGAAINAALLYLLARWMGKRFNRT